MLAFPDEATMTDPILGDITQDDGLEALATRELPVPIFGSSCRFVFDDLEHDPRPEEVLAAAKNLLQAGPDVLASAAPHVMQYCNELLALLEEDERPMAPLEKPAEVWPHVSFGDVLAVHRRQDGDSEDGVYVSMERNCDWEVEHGLQLVFRDGRRITKVGMYDGHLTNSDASGNRSLAGVVFKGFGRS
jgi:hypothetical protein